MDRPDVTARAASPAHLHTSEKPLVLPTVWVGSDFARFNRFGVGRTTFGPLLQTALTDSMTDIING